MDELVEAVREAAGLRAPAHAAAALRAVLVPLGAMIPHHRREMIVAALPSPAGDALRELPYDASRGAVWLAETVANEEHVRTSFGLEHVEAVLGVVRDKLPADVWGVLFAELPEDVRALVRAPRDVTTPERPSRPAPGRGHGLADGRPGSAHPIASTGGED